MTFMYCSLIYLTLRINLKREGNKLFADVKTQEQGVII